MRTGDIYRALSRNDNLKPAAESIKKAVLMECQKKTKADLVDAIMKMDKWNNLPDQIGFPGMQTNISGTKHKQASGIMDRALFGALDGGMSSQDLSPYSQLMGNRINSMKPPEVEGPKYTKEGYWDKGGNWIPNTAYEEQLHKRKIKSDDIKDENVAAANERDDKIRVEKRELKKQEETKKLLKKEEEENNIPMVNNHADYAKLVSGIAEIEKIAKRAPDKVIREGNKKDGEIIDKIFYRHENGKQLLDDLGEPITGNQNDVNEYKEHLKNEHQQTAIKLIEQYVAKTEIPLNQAIEKIRARVKNSDESLGVIMQKFKEANPDTPDQAMKLLTAYFQINLL